MPDNKEIQGKRIRYLRETLGYEKQGQFAAELGLEQGSYSSIERGKSRFSIRTLEILSHKFGVNLNWLLSGIEPMLTEDLPSVASEPQTAYVKSNLLVPVSAQAGYVADWTQEWVEQNLQRIHIPGITGDVRTFEVKGDSMMPTIRPGDYLVGRKVERVEDIKQNYIHIVVTRLAGISIKRVIRDDSTLILESDNEEYAPTTLPGEELKEIYYAVMRLTRNLSGPRPYDARLAKVEGFLHMQFPKEFRVEEDEEL